MRGRSATVRTRILDMLDDGQPHRSDEIAATVSEAHGFSYKYVTTALSFFANYRTIRRTWDGKFWTYQRVDVEHAA